MSDACMAGCVPEVWENTTLSPSRPVSSLIDYKTREVVEFVNFVVLCGLISFLGMLANIINITVYVKMGVKDSITISFVALAISDFSSLITLFWISICFNPLVWYSTTVPFEPLEMQYVPGSWAHGGFARVSGVLTVVITVERCLCVALPLKVNQILTPTRTKLLIVCAYALGVIEVAPVFYANQYAEKFSPFRNRTIVGIVPMPNRVELENFSLSFGVAMRYIFFFSVIVATVILAVTLKKKTKWREQQNVSTASTSSKKADAVGAMSARDKRVSKMVVLISTTFIVCYTPAMATSVGMIVVEPYSISGAYVNLFVVTWSSTFVFEAINASLNVFFYYRMSARFRETFLAMFHARGAAAAST